ncbi:MAG TPA: peptidylprolyl isomerase [Pirellulaceae bacterium]|nr:peptidylprolyl isomerase [Planctomycetales bacterium]HRX79581.1 peptidylprolyl isomerase [Pirellulaceae bacterium]
MLRCISSLRATVSLLILVSPITFTLSSTARGQDAPATEAPATEAAPAAEAPPAEATPAATTPQPEKAEPEKTEPAPAPEPKPETPPASPKPAAAAADEVAAENGGAAAAFAAKLNEWKSLLKQLRELQTDYEEADEDALVPILKRWNELMAQGDQMVSELGELGAKAFAASPNEDRELTRFLVKVLADDAGRDAYEEANVIAQSLIDNGCEDAEIFSHGAVAAFCTNDFDRAEKYFKLASERGALSEEARKFVGLLDEYRTYWEAEQEIRKKEAAADDLPRVKITTSKGDMIVELFENEAPGAVGNFISLVEKGFYDGLTFHRVLEHFMAQGGCPNGVGNGGPGYNIYCECKQDNYRKHFRGTLSMAHAGPDTGGSQFFITFVPTPHLNGLHTAFGRVIEGFDVMAKLERIDPDAKDKPQPDRIEKIEVLRKRDHEYAPNKVQ